jgi:hypothetical protein
LQAKSAGLAHSHLISATSKPVKAVFILYDQHYIATINLDDKRPYLHGHRNKSISFTGSSYVFTGNEKLWVTGGVGLRSEGCTNSCHTYNYRTNKFHEWDEKMNVPRAFHCSYFLSKITYVFGGVAQLSAEYFAPGRTRWIMVSDVIPFDQHVKEFSCAYFNNSIYIAST